MLPINKHTEEKLINIDFNNIVYLILFSDFLFVYLHQKQITIKYKIMITFNKETVKAVIECDDQTKIMDYFKQLQDEIIKENTLNDIVEFAAQCLVHKLAIPQIPVTVMQFESIKRMFKIKGIDGRGGDRKSKKFKEQQESK